MNNTGSNNDQVENVGNALEGERTIPSVNARKRPPIAVIGIVVAVAVIAVGLLMSANKGDGKGEREAKKVAEQAKREENKDVGKKMPAIDFSVADKPDPVPVPIVASAQAGDASAAPPLPGKSGGKEEKPDREALRLAKEQQRAREEAAKARQERREAKPLAFTASSHESTAEKGERLAQQFGGAGGVPEEDNGLNVKLKKTALKGARAGILPHPNFMLTKGHFLNCTLEQAVNSTLAGMLSCRLSEDVYSTNQKVLLVERGSLITGEYLRGLMKGQARLFVLWTRIETTNHVIVDLDSPGTDSLGRSGIDGYVNHHFWERFGAAIMFSLIDDVGQYAIAKAQDTNETQINFGGTAEASDDIATEVLKYSIDIPPTLEKNQGGDVSIYVARDLDFSDVYSLASY